MDTINCAVCENDTFFLHDGDLVECTECGCFNGDRVTNKRLSAENEALRKAPNDDAIAERTFVEYDLMRHPDSPFLDRGQIVAVLVAYKAAIEAAREG